MRFSARLFLLAFLFFLPQNAFAETSYLAPGQVDLTLFLAPPPAPGSYTQQQEIKTLLQFQAERTPAMVAFARADATLSIFRFADILGDRFDPAHLPLTKAFFDRVAETAHAVSNPAKAAWGRPRPYEFSAALRPCVDKPGNASYPSGHSTFITTTSIVLAAMLPEKRAEIFDRAAAYRLNREIGGAHYPSDVRAGEMAGTLIAAALFQNQAFQADFDKARAELRPALGY